MRIARASAALGRALIALVLAAGCHPAPGGYATRGNPTTSPAPTSTSGGESSPAASAETGAALAPAVRPPAHEADTWAAPCLYDAGTDRYEVCAHITNDGQCAAFGEPCGPTEMGSSATVTPCMYQGGANRYARCNHVTTDGRCAAYAGWCGPDDMRRDDGTPPCMFDASDGRLKQCAHVTTDGRCASFGAVCRQ